ncbi:hypothetical protein OCF84_21360 (plasmid) [Shewanella xiamenensis]|uniref:Uncharacterized protein n=2 Tax=Shewanella xiamenensis TaxID=332186 RepID=A0ABT6UH23_9GAMM|nr:hypothetical protein [Shewanella xiamenensis]MDI5832574.1 hypothetical protein [Shewanella xiamenensis]WHF57807.1 hypothetical protein OCF84_21360 [Shewanella xiamenensis]
MLTLNTNCYGITITYDSSDKERASISSEMKAQDTSVNKTFNVAVDALESIILAHFCAGLDVSSPAYLQGIEEAYQALCNHIDEDDELLEDTKSSSSNNDELKPFCVSAYEYKGDEQTIDFHCLAMDKCHAEEQALNAYPHGEVKLIKEITAEEYPYEIH